MERELLKTLTDRMDVYRHRVAGQREHRELVYKGLACALSRSSYTHSPTPIGAYDRYADKDYRLRIFAPKNTEIDIGDYVEITRGNKIFKGYSSDSFSYDTHTVFVLEITDSEGGIC